MLDENVWPSLIRRLIPPKVIGIHFTFVTKIPGDTLLTKMPAELLPFIETSRLVPLTSSVHNVSVNSKREHPPQGNPQALDPCSAPHSGTFDANRSPTHRAFNPSKKCWSSVAREKDVVLYVTSHNFSWFSTTYMLIYVISNVLKKFGNMPL